MLNKGCNPDVITYKTVSDGLGKEGKLQEALGLLDVMVKICIPPDQITYSTLINGFCRAGNPEKAGKLLQEMPERLQT